MVCFHFIIANVTFFFLLFNNRILFVLKVSPPHKRVNMFKCMHSAAFKQFIESERFSTYCNINSFFIQQRSR